MSCEDLIGKVWFLQNKLCIYSFKLSPILSRTILISVQGACDQWRWNVIRLHRAEDLQPRTPEFRCRKPQPHTCSKHTKSALSHNLHVFYDPQTTKTTYWKREVWPKTAIRVSSHCAELHFSKSTSLQAQMRSMTCSWYDVPLPPPHSDFDGKLWKWVRYLWDAAGRSRANTRRVKERGEKGE